MAQATMIITTKRTWQFSITMFLLNRGMGKLALKLFEHSRMMTCSTGSKKSHVYLSEFWKEVKNG